ncbi:unnamed protein product [Clonostachys chloroleuca]|uniref:Protein SKT5 n=1 Tax=Clonostachys chloroleuca TaxID=1926264 RepID=A0AA35MKM8_9HYPO|nr:unnamed protein product [Clonostachys chloroleuca]
MAAVTTSPPPPPAYPAPTSPPEPTSPQRLQRTSTGDREILRKPVAAHMAPLHAAPSHASPADVNFSHDSWANPTYPTSPEQTGPVSPQFVLTDRSRALAPSPNSPTSPGTSSQPSLTTVVETPRADHQEDYQGPASPDAGRSSAALDSRNPSSTSPDAYDHPEYNPTPSAMNPHERVKRQEMYRNSRGSDDTASSSQQPTSTESSATTSASSILGNNENPDSQLPEESPGSSVIEGDFPRNQSVPQFQYHHQEQEQQVMHGHSASYQDVRNASTPDLSDGSAQAKRHLTPNNSQFFRRSSIPRPQSSYSLASDMAPRGRSPGLQSRNSPDMRPQSYAELLNVPYPQQAPAPLALDNSNLRTVIGNNASLLSTQKTLEMYRQNVKKTNDVSIQYSFAVFLISTAQELGLDFSDPKRRKNASKQRKETDSPDPDLAGQDGHALVREARQLLQKLANGGYPFAQYYLADGFASGLFNKGKEDYSSAFPLFVLAAKHGHAESAFRTALCYEFGWGCRKDPAKAVQFLRSAASKRHPGAMTRLGKACLSGDLGEKRYREGIKWLKLAAEAADAQYNAAPYHLGCLYETGYGDDIFKDEHYAAQLFTQAADLGHPEASFRMGDAYEHGLLDCPRDPSLSVHFYTGAAERGHAGAMMGLCAWYMVGAPPVLEKDEEEAYEWAHRSAELGFVKAQYAVGYFTEMGIGCHRDILEANVWYVQAADAGDERAKQRLAIIQAAVSGQGTPMDVAAPRSGKALKSSKDDKDCIVM